MTFSNTVTKNSTWSFRFFANCVQKFYPYLKIRLSKYHCKLFSLVKKHYNSTFQSKFSVRKIARRISLNVLRVGRILGGGSDVSGSKSSGIERVRVVLFGIFRVSSGFGYLSFSSSGFGYLIWYSRAGIGYFTKRIFFSKMLKIA